MSAFAESKYFHGGGSAIAVTLTREQIKLADCLHGELLATAIDRETNRDGGRWFSLGRLNLSSASADIVHKGEALGLWVRRDGKDYWRFNDRTWAWVKTAMVLGVDRRAKNA